MAGDWRFSENLAPAGELWRVPFFPSPATLGRAFVRKRGKALAPGPFESQPDGALGLPEFSFWDGWMRRLLQWSATPDELVGWVPMAVAAGILARIRTGCQAVLASGPPFSAVLAGVLVRRLTGMRLIADFRDAWTLDPVDHAGAVRGTFRAPRGRRRDALLRRLEQEAMRQADWVLFTSDHTAEAYRQTFPGLQRKSTVVYNGAEEADFAVPPDISAPFTFNYVGTLQEHQAPGVDLFLRAFSLALTLEPALARAQVRIFGARSAALDHALVQLASDLNLGAFVVWGQALPHSRAAAILKSRGVNLLFAGASDFTRLSKVSDCIAVRRPALALARASSETARHIQAAGGHVYSGVSTAELAALIVQLWRSHRDDPEEPGPFPLSPSHPLHWQRASEEVAAILDRLAVAQMAGPHGLVER